MKSLIINETIKSHIPPLRADELAQLEENILREGCKTPIVTWEGTIIDGHNRYDICTRHSIEFKTDKMLFADIDSAIVWIEENQLGRRNLTADQFNYFIGRKYDRMKKSQGRPCGKSRQNDDLKTNAKIAAEHGIGERTVERAAEFSRNVDSIAEQIGDSARSEILSGLDSFTRADVSEIASALPRAKDVGLTFTSPKEALDWAKQHRAERQGDKKERRGDDLADRIDELEAVNEELVAESVKLKAQVSVLEPMRIEYERGGFAEVIKNLGDQIRVLKTRIETESQEKVKNLRSAEYWKGEAIKLGWSRNEVIELGATHG